jgi:septum formation inhibitor MinC
MDSSNAFMHPVDDGLIAAVPQAPEDSRPAALLRGTARGLEIVVQGKATVDAIALAILARLDEAPGFFRGSDVRIRVEDGPLPVGCLARVDGIASRFELRIVEVTAAKTAADSDAVPKQPSFAAGSAPTGFEEEPTLTAAAAYVAIPKAPVLPAASPAHASDEPVTLAPAELSAAVESGDELSPFGEEQPTHTAAPIALAATSEIELETITSGTRLVVGPVRSGVILEHKGHLVVFGDVNPGAEIRAEGNIVVLGRLRGTAHAGIGQDVGFIMALRLEPQQLRIGRTVARASDSDQSASEAEIAYGTGDGIVVERYQGKLPRNLATSI